MATQSPASYKELAEEVGKSPATIKTQLCSLRNKGIPVEEYADPAGAKKFYLPEEVKQSV